MRSCSTASNNGSGSSAARVTKPIRFESFILVRNRSRLASSPGVDHATSSQVASNRVNITVCVTTALEGLICVLQRCYILATFLQQLQDISADVHEPRLLLLHAQIAEHLVTTNYNKRICIHDECLVCSACLKASCVDLILRTAMLARPG